MHRGIGRGHAVSNIAIVLEAYEAALRRIVAVAVAADLVVVRRESAIALPATTLEMRGATKKMQSVLKNMLKERCADDCRQKGGSDGRAFMSIPTT